MCACQDGIFWHSRTCTRFTHGWSVQHVHVLHRWSVPQRTYMHTYACIHMGQCLASKQHNASGPPCPISHPCSHPPLSCDIPRPPNSRTCGSGHCVSPRVVKQLLVPPPPAHRQCPRIIVTPDLGQRTPGPDSAASSRARLAYSLRPWTARTMFEQMLQRQSCRCPGRTPQVRGRS